MSSSCRFSVVGGGLVCPVRRRVAGWEARCGSRRDSGAADILMKLCEGLHNGLRHHFHPGVDVIDNAFDDFGVELCNIVAFGVSGVEVREAAASGRP